MNAVATLGHGCLSATVKANHHFHSPKLKAAQPHKLFSLPNPNTNTNQASLVLSSSKPSRFAVKTAADSNGNASSESKEEDGGKKKYYFVVANAKFMLDEEEHFNEQMFERLRLFGERNMEQDFWLVIEPKFLDNFPNITNRLRRPAVALVSTNGTWITFMKLRLDRVLEGSFEAESMEEALASNPTDIKFDKPKNWVAPYTKYEPGWWETFLPPGSKTKVNV